MKIYDYLFFKGYQLALRSGNYDGMLALGAISFVSVCVMFNVFTLFLVLEGFNVAQVSFAKEYKFIFVIGLILLLFAYYFYKSRHKKIMEKYEQKEQLSRKGLHPIIVFIGYYGISAVLLFLAAFFKNGDWIFAK